MKKLVADIYKVYRDPESSGWGYSYFVQREQGNLFFARMAKTASIVGEFDELHKKGGIDRIYITDFHFAGKNVDAVAKEFDAPIFCSEIELPKIQKRGVEHLTAFKFEQREIEEGLSAVPTPGHTAGGVCYLLLHKGEKYLFTGDFLYFDGVEWVVGNEDFSEVKASLQKLKGVPFDWLVGCGDDALGTPHIALDDEGKEHFFADIERRYTAK